MQLNENGLKVPQIKMRFSTRTKTKCEDTITCVKDWAGEQNFPLNLLFAFITHFAEQIPNDYFRTTKKKCCVCTRRLKSAVVSDACFLYSKSACLTPLGA